MDLLVLLYGVFTSNIKVSLKPGLLGSRSLQALVPLNKLLRNYIKLLLVGDGVAISVFSSKLQILRELIVFCAGGFVRGSG